MTPAERALADKGGRGFADLCNDMREAKREHIRAIDRVTACKAAVVAAEAEAGERLHALEDADDALNAFIDRECAVERAS